MNATSTSTFKLVRTFCTRATRWTPKTFSTVNTATSAAASHCAPPRCSAQSPEPAITGAFSARTSGKKCPT